jgi:integral membrane sensor domain MASE1
MKNMLFPIVNWLSCSPRRAVSIVQFILLVTVVITAVVTGDAALAGPITSGS